MDPVTHTLVGASLSSTSLGRKTRLAAPACIVGANLPDLDVFSYFVGGDVAIGFRRGWTHGALALVVLPALLAAVLWLWSRVLAPGEHSPPLATRWLVAICYLAVLTHPCLDWLNTYGLRWMMPCKNTWFYGDSTFIVDPWLWLILGCCWLLGKRANWIRSVGWLLPMGLLLFSLRRSAPQYLPLLASVFLLALLAFFWRPPESLAVRQRVAATGLVAASIYIALLLSIHAATVSRVGKELDRLSLQPVNEMMVGPTPTNPLVWDVVVGLGNEYRFGRFRWTSSNKLDLADTSLPAARPAPIWSEIESSGQLEGYLSWVRFPWYEIEETESHRLVHIMDARYRRSRTEGFGGATVRLPKPTSGR